MLQVTEAKFCYSGWEISQDRRWCHETGRKLPKYP
jgi:hypothetical protein